MKSVTGKIILAVGLVLLAYEFVAILNPGEGFPTISEWVWAHTVDAGAVGAPWIALFGILGGHFVIGKRKPLFPNSMYWLLGYMIFEAVAALVDRNPAGKPFATPAMWVYVWCGIGQIAPFAYGVLLGGLFWTRKAK